VSTDEEPLASETAAQATDAAAAAPSHDPADAASADTLAELRDIEAMPLVGRAPAYQRLADRLRAELEHSDPSRGPS